MRVSTFRSVGAKLFYYMTALVLITVAGNSFQFAKKFMASQTKQIQDSLLKDAETAAKAFKNTIETWKGQIAVSLPTLRSVDDKATDPLQRFVDSNPDFIGLQIIEAPGPTASKFTVLSEAFTANTSAKEFEEKDPDKVRPLIKTTELRWLRKQAPKMKKGMNVAVESIAKSVGLPVIVMATRFEVAGSTHVLWAVLTAWQTKLIEPLPGSTFKSSFVIDGKGKVFSSPKPEAMMRRLQLDTAGPLVKSALKGTKPSDFEPEYKLNGQRHLGAFARLPDYGLAVLVEQDAEQAYQDLRQQLLYTGLWAGLFILLAVMFSFLGAAGITKGLRAVTYATGRIAAGDLKYQIPPGSQDEVGLLGQSVNHMSSKITVLMQSQVDKARFEKELETAKMVQSTFFPKNEIKTKETVVTGFFEPASECGGDLWGHFTVAEGIEFVFIADAMGHGAPAALVTAMAYSTTMTIADLVKHEVGFRDSPSKLLERLNRIIYDAVRGTISMTFFASIIDTRKGVLTYANAGHNFPVVVPLEPGDPRSGKPSKKTAKAGGVQPISLKLMGTPLGMDPETKFKEQTLELRPGDKIFYFTDGLIECTNVKGEAWGRKHLVEQVAEAARLGAEAMRDEVVNKAFSFFGTKPLDDDVTLVVAEIARDWQPRPQEAQPQAPLLVEATAADAKSPTAAPQLGPQPVQAAVPRPFSPGVARSEPPTRLPTVPPTPTVAASRADPVPVTAPSKASSSPTLDLAPGPLPQPRAAPPTVPVRTQASPTNAPSPVAPTAATRSAQASQTSGKPAATPPTTPSQATQGSAPGAQPPLSPAASAQNQAPPSSVLRPRQPQPPAAPNLEDPVTIGPPESMHPLSEDLELDLFGTDEPRSLPPMGLSKHAVAPPAAAAPMPALTATQPPQAAPRPAPVGPRASQAAAPASRSPAQPPSPAPVQLTQPKPTGQTPRPAAPHVPLRSPLVQQAPTPSPTAAPRSLSDKGKFKLKLPKTS